MITEFTCGIFKAVFLPKECEMWQVFINQTVTLLIDSDGSRVHFVDIMPSLDTSELIEIAVLMNNIKRQYNQLTDNESNQ